jgi:phage gpG-like protein
MASVVDITVSATGSDLLRSLTERFGQPDVLAELHRRWGIRTLNWVDQNFRQQGALTGSPWAKLRPLTVAQRRKGSSLILQDTGALKRSFVMQFSSAGVAVGSPIFYAEFHEEGRRGPWEIRPKDPDGILAFKGTDGKTIFAKVVKHPGYPARRMLPRQSDASFMQMLVDTAANYYRELERSAP